MKRFFALLVCLCLVLGMVPSGVTFTANAETNDALVLDDQSQALCPVCNQTVTWTPINNKGRVGPITDGGSQHFYLAEDVTAANAQFAELSKTSVCLNLNGKKLIMKGRIQLYANSTFNITPFLQLKKLPTHPSPLERNHEGPEHIQGSPVSASELEMRDPFTVS